MTFEDDGYDDESEEDYLFNENVHAILNNMVIPRIDSVVQEVQNEMPELDKIGFGNEIHKRLFNDDVMEKLYEVGFDQEDFRDIELNVFSIELGGDFDSIVEKLDSIEDEEEKQEYILNMLENKDKYLIDSKRDNCLTFNTYDIKESLTTDNIEPITEDEFNKMLGH